MIYLKETDSTLIIPRHTKNSGNSFTVILSSNLTNNYTIVDNKDDVSDNELFYQFEIDLPTLTVGEYTYKVYNDFSEVVEVGYLVYGNWKNEKTVNNTFNKKKIQYNG